MAKRKATSFGQFKAELLKQPEVRAEYDALKPEYAMIRSIIKRRIQLKMSQAQLARIVGTQQPAISRLEKGDQNTRISTLFKVANALDLDVTVKARRNGNQARTKTHV